MWYRALLLVLSVLLTIPTLAQSKWAWATGDAGISYNINPTYPRQVVAAHEGHVLWGVIQNKKMTYRQVMLGDYRFYDYDSSGNVSANALITGKVSLIAARADAAGNWYILGTFYDSVMLSNGMNLVRLGTGTGSEYFLLRLHAGTLAPDWLQLVGGSYYCSTDCFTLRGGDIYLPIDSADGTAICRYNTTTGARTTLWSQKGRTYTSYIDADNSGNIYLMGHCSLAGGLNFNGTISTPPPSAQYPWYIARYHSNGQHHWHYWLTDITCTSRSFLLGNNNAVYLSGELSDSTSLGTFHFAKPTSLFYSDFIMARLDSNGTLLWAQQRPITSITQGGIFFSSSFHMATVDTALYMFCETQGTSVWGGGIGTQTANNRHNATLVAYGAAGGGAIWAKVIAAGYSIAQHIITDGTDIWVTGVGLDSAALRFDSVHIPTAPGNYIPYLAKLNLKQRPLANGITTVAATAFTIWPNPAKTTLHIQSNPARQLIIRDLTGRLIWHTYMPAKRTDVDISGWPRGIYMLESSGSDGREVRKVLLD